MLEAGDLLEVIKTVVDGEEVWDFGSQLTPTLWSITHDHNHILLRSLQRAD